MTAEKIAELKRLWAQIANVPLGGIGGRIVNAFPDLIASLEAATVELSQLRQAIGLLTCETPEVEIDVLDPVGMARQMVVSLAARDARMKAEGAIEALEDIAKDAGVDGGKAYFATVVYREFPDRLTTKVGVVEAADIMAKAAELRLKERK